MTTAVVSASESGSPKQQADTDDSAVGRTDVGGVQLVDWEHALVAPERAQSVLDEPLECSAHRFQDPAHLAQALPTIQSSDLPFEEKLAYLKVVLRGCSTCFSPEMRDVGYSLSQDLEKVSSPSRLEELLEVGAMQLQEASMNTYEELQDVVRHWPIPIEAFLTASCQPLSSTTMDNLKTMDILKMDPDVAPEGMPHVAHAFLALLSWREGPMYRHKGDYIRIHKSERDHLPWAVEHIRGLARDFWAQYRRHQLQAGRTEGNLAMQLDAFLAVVVDKMFALSLKEQLPELAQRQAVLDTAGCVRSRYIFAQRYMPASAPPPPLRRQDNLGAEHPYRLWVARHLWTRRRTPRLLPKWLPSARALGEMALKTPLRHRPFVSMLSSMHSHEENLLLPWYSEAQAEDPILHVLPSAELIQELGKYLEEALRAAHFVRRGNPTSRLDSPVLPLLVVGSGASRFQTYLSHILARRMPEFDVRVVGIVPAKDNSPLRNLDEAPQAIYWPSLDKELTKLPLARGDLTLKEALRAYQPLIVLCAGMPPRVDWSQHFRLQPSVMEYLILGPENTDRSGNAYMTWGQASAFKDRGRAPAKASYEVDGWVRRSVQELSANLLGTDDAPGRVGTNVVNSFRRQLGAPAQNLLPTGAPTRFLPPSRPSLKQ